MRTVSPVTKRASSEHRKAATSAISMFVWLLAVAYLYTEVATDERAMGMFILVVVLAL